MTFNLSPEELQKANAYAEKIDLQNTALVMQYATPVQRRITNYSNQALAIATGNASGEAIDIINRLMEKIRSFANPRKGLLGLGRKDATDWREEYQTMSGDIKSLALQLEQLQFQLYKDMGLYQEMHKQNRLARQELLLYLQAGQTKLDKAKHLELPTLESTYQLQPSAENQLKHSHYEQQVAQFEQKLQDLKLTQIISEQFEQQLDLMYQTAQRLSEKLQATITHTIPLWQNQVVIALGLDRIEQARAADRQLEAMELAEPAERIEQLTENILRDMRDKKTELQALGPNDSK